MTCLQSSWGGSKKLYAGKPMQAGYFTRSVRSGIPKLNSGFSSHKLFSVLLVLLNLVLTMAQSDDFARKSTEFYTKLFSAVSAEKQDKNIILSPFSIQTCLALAYMGAGGKTAEEISLGIGLASNNRATVAESFGNILDQYIENPQLKIANKVYVKQNLKLKPDFNEIARKRFYSEAESVDFTKNLDAARTINLWVEQHTNNKIKDVISADSLNDDTRCVLVNAIYFKGLWAKKFNPEATRKDDFYISETETVPVDMMFVNGKFKYGYSSDLDASVLELPYENSSLSMLIILPTKRTGLKDLESKINEKSLEELQKGMYKVEVDVKLPKFKIEFEIQLKPILEKLGMKSMFSQGNFDNLLNTAEPLKVSEVIHKAFIDVNEEGTEAAAATVVQMVAYSMVMNEEQRSFTADHPFVYALLDNCNENKIMFFGKFLNPEC